MINRSFLSLFFAFLLTFAQQLAMQHPYEHAADWQQKPSSHKNTLPHSETCGKCIALAGIASAVSSKSPAVHVVTAKFELSSFVKQPIISAHFFSYLSRAPPSLA